MKRKFREKSIGYVLFLLAAVLDLIALILYIIYTLSGGRADAVVFVALALSMVAVILLFFYDGLFADVIAALPSVCSAIAFAFTLDGGVGNIADWAENIVMYGLKELAIYNFLLAALLAAGSIVSLVACFMRRTKKSASGSDACLTEETVDKACGADLDD